MSTDTGRRSLTRGPHPGVTVLPSAEGPSLRSDPRWSADAGRRAERLLAAAIRRRLISPGGTGRSGPRSPGGEA